MRAISNSIQPDPAQNLIRPFNPARDLQRVADLIELCFADSLDQDGRQYLHQMRNYANQSDWITRLPRFAEWTGAPFVGYIWEEGDELIGNVSLIPYQLSGKRHYLIANVAVHPEYRRRGIAKNLTLQAMEHARQHRAAAIWLSVKEGNLAANELYKGLGFQERNRRTTWHAQHEYSKATKPNSISIRKRQSSDWRAQHSWFNRSYPGEVRWNLPFNLRLLEPGILGSVLRLFSSISVKHWVAYRSDQLLATVTLQTSLQHSGRIWLGTPEHCNLSALQDFLYFARQQIPPRNLYILEYPVSTADMAIQAAGFKKHQTLVWMEYEQI